MWQAEEKGHINRGHDHGPAGHCTGQFDPWILRSTCPGRTHSRMGMWLNTDADLCLRRRTT